MVDLPPLTLRHIRGSLRAGFRCVETNCRSCRCEVLLEDDALRVFAKFSAEETARLAAKCKKIACVADTLAGRDVFGFKPVEADAYPVFQLDFGPGSGYRLWGGFNPSKSLFVFVDGGQKPKPNRQGSRIQAAGKRLAKLNWDGLVHCRREF